MNGLKLLMLSLVLGSIAWANNVTDTLTSGQTPNVGDVLWYSGVSGNTAGTWSQPSSIPGLTGATGETGAVGIQGEQGIPGVQGIQGSQGVQGDQGKTGATGNTGVIGTLSADGELVSGMSSINVAGEGVHVTQTGGAATLNLINLHTLQGNQNQADIANETSARMAGDAALQGQVDGLNVRTQDSANRIDRLEQTKYILEGVVRLHDSKHFQVQVFDSYDVRHGANFMVGVRGMLKLGKSYEERVIERQEAEIKALERAFLSRLKISK